jgi:hypothetical protein
MLFVGAVTDLCIRVLKDIPNDQLKAFVAPLAKAVANFVKAGIDEIHFAEMKALAKSQIERAKASTTRSPQDDGKHPKTKHSVLAKWDTELGTPERAIELEEEPDPYEGQEGVWQWQADGGEWRDFSSFVQCLIERSRAVKSTKVVFDRPAVYVTIEVFWREGFQRNTLTGQCRDVRLCPTSSSKDSSKLAPFLPSPVSSPSSPIRGSSPVPEIKLARETPTRGKRVGMEITVSPSKRPSRTTLGIVPAASVRASPRRTG